MTTEPKKLRRLNPKKEDDLTQKRRRPNPKNEKELTQKNEDDLSNTHFLTDLIIVHTHGS